MYVVASGTRLGPYEIVSRIGAGGMGEVWKARDTRLDRSVAIKILPAEFAADAQLKTRFEREAKTISQLNHPNICTLHDVGENYLVMELLEGESLAERLEKGPLPLNEVLRYGAQIADALDRAHRAGVVHRDLKPGNIMITKAGAKLLDFGLAKSAIIDVSADGATVQKPLTQEGTILGTFQYMAPEQLEGEEADPRTDIFALGAVLYEMATGRRAFEGKTKTSLIAAIVKEQPRRISEMQPLTPPALEHVIAACLEKEPDDRWQSAHDVAQELRWIAEAGSQPAVAAPVVSRGRWRRRMFVAATGFLLGVATTAAVWKWQTPARQVPLHTSLLAPDGCTLLAESGALALSPDGSRVTFVAQKPDASTALFVRSLSSPVATELQGTRGASHPFWSPDGQFIGFFAEGALRRISPGGGPAQMICTGTSEPRGAAWSESGVIVFSPNFRSGLFQVPAIGGTPAPLTKLEANEQSHRWPVFLPGGKEIVFLAQRGEAGSTDDESALEVISIDGRKRSVLTRVNSSAAYAEGHLLFWRDRTLVAQPLDPGKLELTGNPVPIAENVRFTTLERAVFDVSRSGLLAYQTGGAAQLSELVWVVRGGRRLDVVGATAAYAAPTLSNNERMLATSITGQSEDVWLFDLERGTQTRFTFDAANEMTPVWSPDDSRLIFARVTDLAEKTLAGEMRILAKSTDPVWPSDWSRDGKLVLLDTVSAAGGGDIGVYSFAEGRLRILLQTPFSEYLPKFSPDARWITYVSDQSGRAEIYVRPFGGAGLFQLSADGGGSPRWSPKGDEIFYVAPGGDMMAVPVDTSSGFRAGLPQRLFRIETGNPRGDTMYDVTSDAQRFIIGARVESKQTEAINLVQNWTALLKR